MKKTAAALLLVLASLALVACGSSSSSSTSTASEGGGSTSSGPAGATSGGEKKAAASGQVVELEADPSGQLSYTTATASAKSGEVTVDFTNPQGLEHDVAIENSKGEVVAQTELVAEGSTSAAVELKPGTYHYFCTVPGHRQAGMEGTLVVKK